ncbi:uncharacterized protein PRD47_019089 [Ara ararauna]
MGGGRHSHSRDACREPEPKLGITREVAAVCRLREEALEELLELRPPSRPQDLTKLWLQEAKALLSRHSPGEVLGALERLRKEDPKISPDLDPHLGADAQPPVKSLIQDCWVDVGEVWDRVSAVASRLPPLRLRLLQLQQEIHQRLEGDPQAQEAARLMVEAARLSGARAALTKQAQELRGSLMGSPESALEPLRRQLQEGKQRLSRRWIQLQALAESNGKLLAQLRPLQAQPPRGRCCRWRRCGGSCSSCGGRGQRRGAWPAEGAWPEKPRPSAEGVASAELLPQLQALSNEIRQLIQDWPRLQDTISQWWQQPAQWTPAPAPRQHPLLPLAEALVAGQPYPGLAPPPPLSPAHQRRGRAGPEGGKPRP